MTADFNDDYCTTQEAAEFLHVSEVTLYLWRTKKNVNLDFIRLPGKILYRKADLIAFMEKHQKHSGNS